MSRIAVVGSGYVGLVTGACLAKLGHTVTCLDIDHERVHALRQGVMPIFEEGLGELVGECVEANRLSFELSEPKRVEAAEFVFLCVPTPSSADGSADLSYLQAAAAELVPACQPGTIIINKSTVPVGSTRLVEMVIQRDDISVVSNPEFLREGTAVADFMNPDRIVIGSDDRAAAAKVAELYADLNATVMLTDPASAETIKYAANAFLATKLSFVNAVAAVCEAVNADVSDVMLGIGHDKRIGHHFLRPGPGWGGSCLPKDTAAMIRIADEAGYDFSLLRGVVEVNDDQIDRIVAKLRALVGGLLRGRRIGVLGLAFKAGTDDVRESPAVKVVERLITLGCEVVAYDPQAIVSLPGLEQVDDAYTAATNSDAVILLTEWPEFVSLDIARLAELMRQPNVVDARNLLDREALLAAGFGYAAIGRTAG